MLTTASFDSTIGIWVSEEGEWECVSTLEGHETECKSVGYSCTGTLLASCSRDKTVWIWEGEQRVSVLKGNFILKKTILDSAA
jgi:WD40 repeat protein